MVKLYYDLVVVGDHLGGLAAAALTVKRGRRVLVFEATEEVVEGRPLEYLNAICGGPEREVALVRFFRKLGLSPFGPLGDDRIHFRPLHPPLQVILPEHRVSIYQDKVARNWEVEREFGDVHHHLVQVRRREQEFRERLRRLKPLRRERRRSFLGRGVWSLYQFLRLRAIKREAGRETFAGFLAASPLPPSLVEVLAAQAQGAVRLLPASLPWYAGLGAIRTVQGGLHQNISGQSGLLRGLKEAFYQFGGDCRPLVSLESIELPRAESVKLHLAAGGQVQAGHVIFDLPLETGVRLLPPELINNLRRKGLERTREDCDYGLLEFSIRQGCRPECMGEYLVFTSPAGGDGLGMGTVLLAGQPGGYSAFKGDYSMEALGLFPVGTCGNTGREVIWERLKTVMPFLETSLAGDVRYRTGRCRRFLPRHRRWRRLEDYFSTGYQAPLFRQRQLTFLRNEDYIGTSLVEGLLSGIWAASLLPGFTF